MNLISQKGKFPDRLFEELDPQSDLDYMYSESEDRMEIEEKTKFSTKNSYDATIYNNQSVH